MAEMLSSNLESKYPVKFITTQPLNVEGGYTDGETDRQTYPIGADAEYVDIKDYFIKIDESTTGQQLTDPNNYEIINLQDWINRAYARIEVSGANETLSLQNWLSDAENNVIVSVNEYVINSKSWRAVQPVLKNWLLNAKKYIAVHDYSSKDISLEAWLVDSANNIKVSGRDKEEGNIKDLKLQLWINGVETRVENALEEIEVEVERAIAAETALDGKINTEIDRAENAEADLHNEIVAETNRATEKENALEKQIDDETERAVEKESELEDKIDANTNAIATEETNRKKADTLLEKRIETNEGNIVTISDSNASLSQNLERLKGVVSILSGGTDEAANRIVSLEESVNGTGSSLGLLSRTSTLETQQYVTTSAVNNLTTRVGDAENDITELKDKDNEIRGAVSILQSNIKTAEKDIEALESTVGSSSSGLVKNVNDLKTTVGNSGAGLVKSVNDLKTAVGSSSSGLVKSVNDLSAIYSNTSLNLGRKANTTKGNHSSTLGSLNTAEAENSHAEGKETKALKPGSHAEGYLVTVNSQYTHGEGYNNSIGGISEGASHIEGYGNEADLDSYGAGWHIEGYGNKIADYYGYGNDDGKGPHIEGYCNTSSSQDGSHAEGYYTHVDGKGAHAEGYGSASNRVIAQGAGAHASGYQCFAHGEGAHAMGYKCQTGTNKKQVVVGRSNAVIEDDNCYFIVGADRNTSKYTSFKNGLEVWHNQVKGLTYSAPGSDYAEYIYPYEGEIEQNMKYFVTIKDKKIKKASSKDYIVGIISQEPSVIGGYQQEREDSDFWFPIGMLGVLNVYDDGTCKINEFCKCGNDGIATYASEYGLQTYYVIERISENEIKVILK